MKFIKKMTAAYDVRQRDYELTVKSVKNSAAYKRPGSRKWK